MSKLREFVSRTLSPAASTINFFATAGCNRTTKRGKHALMLVFAAVIALSLVPASEAFADATLPSADAEGSKDSSLLKRYEGSFILSYEKFAFTDFTVPLSPLRKSADQKARDQNNNRLYEAENRKEPLMNANRR